ncbi:MAG TPA: beta-N-acetylhexosaminidase [Rhizobiales bacterium]|nr:beta-N-acetylhexosaminidase [Hyphomicrobiales bacterium]
MPRAFITGCEGLALSAEEKSFFQDAQPFGLILFARNCERPEQIRRLTDEFRDCVGRDEAPVLIDQEGGRVMRLKPPVWREYAPAAKIGELYQRDPDKGLELARVFGRLLAGELYPLGVNVDCVPLLDVPVAGAHEIIGERAFSRDVNTIIALGNALSEGLREGGCLPVIKHIPGHGRAGCDSHEDLPVVSASAQELEASDFLPFKALNGHLFAMSAHVIYSAYDRENPATVSRTVIQDVIRKKIGFSKLLMSDDLSMKALRGSMGERTRAAMAAGCDLALHCNGEMEEMVEVAENVPEFGESAQQMYAEAVASCGHGVYDDDPERYVALLDEVK